ncbi:MAG: hypothetical protein Fur0041_02500 [Bacteroidia bacterium]
MQCYFNPNVSLKIMKTPLLKSILIGALAGCGLGLSAQIPVAWVERYNAPPDNADEARSIAVDASGNVYVTGSGFNSQGNLDAITIKYSPTGQQLWVVNYDRGVGDNDEAVKLVLDDSANVYIVGYSRGMQTSSDILTVKYNTNGVLQWAQHYNGSGNGLDEGRSIAVDGNRNVIVTGYESNSSFATDMTVIKYSANGNQSWVQVVNGSGNGNDEGKDLTVDASDNIYVIGNTEQTSNPPNSDYCTIKYNPAGSQQWMQLFNGPSNSNDYGRAITLDNNNNVIVTGYSFENNNWFDMVTIKYNNSGTQQWTARYNNAANRYEEAWDVVTDPSGNVYVTGQSQAVGNNSTPADYATIKYSSSGTQVWVRRYDGGTDEDDRSFAVALDDSLNVYVTGYSKVGNTDYATIKYSNNGDTLWIMRYNGNANGNDQALALAVDNGDVFVTGKSANQTNDDYLTIKYSYAAVGVNEINPSDALQLYPNPTDNLLNIQLSNGLLTRIQLHDMTGKVIETYNTVPTNSYSMNISGFSSGIYLVTLFGQNNSIIGTQKFIIR